MSAWEWRIVWCAVVALVVWGAIILGDVAENGGDG